MLHASAEKELKNIVQKLGDHMPQGKNQQVGLHNPMPSLLYRLVPRTSAGLRGRPAGLGQHAAGCGMTIGETLVSVPKEGDG